MKMTYTEKQYNDACYTYWTAISKMCIGYIPTTKDDREFKAAIKIKNTYEFEYNDKKVLEQRGHDKAREFGQESSYTIEPVVSCGDCLLEGTKHCVYDDSDDRKGCDEGYHYSDSDWVLGLVKDRERLDRLIELSTDMWKKLTKHKIEGVERYAISKVSSSSTTFDGALIGDDPHDPLTARQAIDALIAMEVSE